jgi:putative salt-induced outer membrane protein
MKFSRHVVLCVTGLVMMANALADAPPPPPPQGIWTGKGQLGFLESSGNTDATALNANLDMTLLEDPWKHELYIGGLYGKSNNITSAERYEGRWQSNYNISPDVFAFGGLRYEHDLFDGFQYQASGTAGLGYKIFNSDSTKLSVQVGAGYRDLRPEILVKDADGNVISRTLEPSSSSAVGTAGLDFTQILTKTTTLTDKALVEAGAGDTLFTNDLALAVKMSTKLALSLGYSIKDNTTPPAGLKKLDTVATANLVYSF